MYKLFIFSLVSLYANFSFGAVCDTVIVGNGIRYEGQYPCGEGVLYSDSLGIYIGHFERGIPNGVCTHYKKNGHRYYGEFKDGEYSGRGIQFWKSGAVCVGDFKNGHCFGTDTIWYKKSIYVGVCVKGHRTETAYYISTRLQDVNIILWKDCLLTESLQADFIRIPMGYFRRPAGISQPTIAKGIPI